MSTAIIDRTKLYGVLNQLDGQRIERQVRVLKVGIGVPIGRDVHTWIDAPGQWCVETGVYAQDKRQSQVRRLRAREEAQAYYDQQRKIAPERKAPHKIPYFTFLRMNGQGQFVHDFDVIEQHGPTPTEIDVVFLTEQTFDAAFQMWSSSKLLCEGDGRNARRRIDIAAGQEEKRLAAEANQSGERFFPIIEGCFARGCRYARGEKPQCKPHGRLYFQLVHSPRIGGACQFDTTGYRSIAQLASSLEQVRSVTGRGSPDLGTVAGIPMKLVLRPYRVQHQGQSSIQYGVSLEFRAASVSELARLLGQHTKEFREFAQLPAASTECDSPAAAATASTPTTVHSEEDDWMAASDGSGSTDPGEVVIGDPEETEAAEAAALSAEFYSDFANGDAPDQAANERAMWDIPNSTAAMPRRRSESRPS